MKIFIMAIFSRLFIQIICCNDVGNDWLPSRHTFFQQAAPDKPVDVVFLLDGSGSMGRGNFELAKSYINTILPKEDINTGRVRVSVIVIMSTYKIEFYLNRYNKSAALVMKAIKNIKYPPGQGTNTHTSLEIINNEIFQYQNGGRSNAEKMCVIIFDGQSNNRIETLNQAQKARDNNIRIVAIGINLNDEGACTELREIAWNQSSSFFATNWTVVSDRLEDSEGMNACPDRMYGPGGRNCWDCHCQKMCSKSTGFCESLCEAGWTKHLHVCKKECPDGKFGLNCSQDCHCQETCHKQTGDCPQCARGWRGVNCQQECPDGRFGLNCSLDCHCEETCDKQTGDCPQCMSGWHGVNCQQECQDGRFGRNCSRDCQCVNTTEVCDKTNGSCQSGCNLGWKGADCKQPDCSYHKLCGDHNCQDVGTSYRCRCLHGYKNSDPQHCEDIDECEQNICVQSTCNNTIGSYECICTGTNQERVDPSLCLAKIELDEIDTVNFRLKNITAKSMIQSISTLVKIFFAAIVILLAKTFGESFWRFYTTEPKKQGGMVIPLIVSRLPMANLYGLGDSSDTGINEVIDERVRDSSSESLKEESSDVSGFLFPWSSQSIRSSSAFGRFLPEMRSSSAFGRFLPEMSSSSIQPTDTK